MSNNPSDTWSPREGTTTFTDTFSPSRYSYTSRSDAQRFSSDGEDSAQNMRRLVVSPSPSQEHDNVDDDYSDDNSLDEVDATLNNLDDELDDTEHALTEWSHSSSFSPGPTFSSATGTFTYSGTYTGSPSFVSLPAFSPRSPPIQPIDPRARLSRITERTEESRPTSTAFSTTNVTRPANPTPDTLRRSALLGGGTPSHSRSSTDPSSDRTLPPPGRLSELRAVFEAQSPSGGHSRAASTPGYRPSSPMFGTGQSITTGYGPGSRPSSPSKSGTGSSGSYSASDMRSSLLSPPPPRPTTSSGFRSTTPSGPRTYTSPSYTAAPSTYSYNSTWTNTNTNTLGGSYTTPGTDSKTYTDSETLTRTSVTPNSGLRRPQTSPRSPLASVRNIVALWKERTPASARPGEKSAPGSVSSVSPPNAPASENDGLYGIRRRVEGARARLRESRAVSNPQVTPTRPVSQDVPDNASIRSGRSGVFPPGFDMNEISNYAQSSEPPIHIGLLWYLNVHASPPYRWQRCQALLYPHMLLLSWLSPGGGRGIVALDLLNCTSVQSAPSPTHPSARDDVGTIAARQQSGEANAQPLMDMLVPFHMLYADGVERLAAESLLERQKWVNRLWEAVNRPIAVPDSASVTRSPTGSIRTILSINSSSSNSSNGSRSTVFVPPLSSLPDISDFISTTSGLSRQSSLVSSHHSRTVDDTVIQNQEYVYPGDSRVITPNRGHSLRRTGSMTDLDEEFKSALNRARGAGGLFGGSPVTISSGSSLGKNIFVTPPPSVGRGSDRARSELSDENFFSAGSSGGLRSNVSSTYFSQTSLTSAGDLRTTTGLTSITGGITTATSETQVAPSTLTSTYRLSDSGSYRSEDSDVSFADSPSTLSRAREIRRRVAGTSRTHSSGYQTDASQSQSSQSDRDNEGSEDGTRTPTGSYTPGSAGSSLSGSHSRSGSSLEGRSRTPTGSYTGSYSGSGSSRSGSQTGSGSYTGGESYTPSGSYTPGSGSYTLQGESNIVDSISSSGVGGHTPISSSETGYDICPSSDLTDLTRPTTTSESETATPFSRGSDTLSEVASEKFVTASQGSPEYATAVVQSSRASITSFESFPSIPGSEEYATAESASTEYRTASEPGMETDFVTASEPSEPSPESAYITADMFGSEVGDIPSEVSTPVLSSLRLGSERDVEERSVVVVPSVVPSIRSPSILSELLPEEIPLPPPSVVPSIRSPSLLSELLPEEIPLPPPSVVPSVRSPSILSELLPEEIPLPLSAPSSAPPPPSRALPVPSPSPSPSLSISPIPTPIESSLEEQDVPTPTSFHMPLPTESSRPDEEESIDEEIVSLSLLSSLPPSTLGSTSVVTPTSIAMLSPSTASTLPPSTPVTPQPTVQSSWVTESSISTSGDLSTFTQTSSSFVPPSPRPWASVTDNSYESSILQSPSTHSIALLEGIETSFETSIFRPSGSPSSIGRMSTIPASISPLTSAPPQSPLQPLTPVPALPLSISSLTDVATPTSLTFSSESSSSLGRTLSTYSTLSYVSQSSLSSSIFDSRSIIDYSEPPEPQPESEPESEQVPEPSTEPSLLSTPPPSSPTPIPTPRISTGSTPEASLVVSITTPQGSGATEQSSLRTIPSISTVTQRDLGEDIDRLADELRTYDHARGLENEEVASNVRALRDELRDLADFLHRPPSPASPVVMHAEPRVPSRQGVQLTDQGVGGSSIISSLHPAGPRMIDMVIPDHPASLSRSTSNASSVASYLSSHYSDDDILEGRDESFPSSQFWGPDQLPTESSSSPDESSSSTVSSSPLSEASSSSERTARPQAPDVLEQSLRAIQDQLRALEDGQTSARDLLNALQSREVPQPEDHTAELADRLQRIENLVQALVDQRHPRGPEIQYEAPPTARTESIISESDDSLGRLARILGELASPLDGPHMPIPVTAQTGPSMVQQLDDILSSSNLPSTGVSEPPGVVPFVYQPAERGERVRSPSPVSMETLPARPSTVPIAYALPPRRPPRREGPRPGATSELDTSTQYTTAPIPFRRTQAPEEPPMHTMRDQAPGQRFHGPPGPTPGPILPTNLYDAGNRRPPTAPASLGQDDTRQGPSWYLPSRRDTTRVQRPSVTTANIPPASTGPSPSAPGAQQQPQRVYMPMPAGPTVLQLPPLFDSLMEILRENRLAQLATVDQQRELMRYMRGLNEWLERDVHDRQSEIRGVVARVEQLSHDLRGMQMRGRRPASRSSGSSDGSETEIIHYPAQGPQMPQPFTGLPPTFQPFATQDNRPVIPPVIPDHRTPPPSFPPVIPTMPPQPTIIVHPGGQPGIQPFIPTDGYHRPVPGPMPMATPRPVEEIFIPPDLSSRSTGSPRAQRPLHIPPRFPNMGADVEHLPPSPSSSRSESTERSRSPSRRRHSSPSRRSSRPGRRLSRSRSRRSRSRSSRGRRSPVPLVITNPSAGMVPAVIQDTQGRIPHQPSIYGQPPIHVVPPSAGSMSPRSYAGQFPPQPQQQQPTIIIQQPGQQQPQQPIIVPSSPGVMMSDAGMMPPGSMGVPMGGMPMGGMPMTGVGVPMTGMPMTPLPPGVPGSYYPPAPMILQQPSRSSSRSRSRSSSRRRHRRSRTPPAQPQPAPTAPVIITDTRRSRSRSPRHTPQPQMPAGVTVLPSQPFGGMPPPGGVVMMPSRSSSRRSHRSHHSRRRSRSPPVIVTQPGPAAPTMYPAPMTQQVPMQQPAVLLQPGMPGFGMQPPVIIPTSRSRSRSRSPRRGGPIVIPPAGQPTSRRSRSRSPRYRPRSRSRSPRHRRSSSPRSRSRRRSRSRTPPRSYGYPPTAPLTTTVIPGPPMVPPMVPGYPPYGRSRVSRSRSRSPSRRSPTRVQVVGDPRSYGRSPRRHSPSRHRYPSYPSRSRSDDRRRGSPTRYSPRRRRPFSPGDRGRDRSPPYTRRDRSRRYHSPSDRSYSPLRRPADTRDHTRRRPGTETRSLSPVSTRGYSPSDPRRRRPGPSSRTRRPGTETRSLSPVSTRGYSPSDPRHRRAGPSSRARSPTRRDEEVADYGRSAIPIRRSRSEGSSARTPTRGRPGSPSPHLVSRHPTGYAPTSEGDRPGTPETLRITVPPRRTDAHRPPTVMTIDDTPGIPGVSRTGTARRPSGGEYTNVHSIYGEPRDSRDRRPRSPESIPDIAVVPSEHDHQTVPSHVPSHVEGLPHLPSSREPTYGEESVPARPASAQRVGDAPRSDTGPPPVHRLPTEASERPAAAQPPPRQATATPFNFHVADESRGQLEELNAAANRLYMTAAAAQEAEDQRELEFRNHEEHREEIFLQNEERRTHEARDRAAGIWDELESRLSALPAPPAPGEVPGEVPVPGEPAQAGDSESIATIRTIATQAATQHASDVLETVREEREAAEREREQAAEERSMLLAELKAEKDRIVEEKDARIRALEDELAQLRGEFEAEKQQRVTEEAEIRERERQEVAERDEYVRAQLGDLTNLVQDQRDMLESKKALMDSRYEETQAHRAEKEMRSIELHDMVQNIYDGMEADRERSQQDRRDSKEALEKIIEDLQRQNAEQRELLQSLSESWRADCEKHHLETIEAVRSTANEQVPFNVQGYLDEFSRALATEVRMLLGEVGKIREERRALQHEIGDLLCMKAKYGPGGEYEPDWKPPGPPPGPPPPDMPPMPDIADVQPPVKPAWRSVHPRPKKKKKAEAQAQAQVRPAASTSAAPMHVAPPSGYDLRQQLTGSWATWQPDRNAQLTPPSVEPTLMVPGRGSPGLRSPGPFGARTPSNASMYEQRR